MKIILFSILLQRIPLPIYLDKLNQYKCAMSYTHALQNICYRLNWCTRTHTRTRYAYVAQNRKCTLSRSLISFISSLACGRTHSSIHLHVRTHSHANCNCRNGVQSTHAQQPSYQSATKQSNGKRINSTGTVEYALSNGTATKIGNSH